jgi:hypothetical protein
MSYTVATKDTRIFRVQITNVSAEFEHFMGEGIYFELNFDNFRTYTSSAGEVDTIRPKYNDEFKFNYETVFADLLAAKLMKITFYKSGSKEQSYLGEASCDLMTLATGCSDCRFSIYETSDSTCGKVYMNVVMEEVAETRVEFKELKVSFQQGRNMPKDMSQARLSIETKAAEPGVRNSKAPEHHDAYNAMWKGSLEPSYFGSTVMSILQEAGLRVRLVEAGFCGSETEYGWGSISIGALPEDQIQNNPRGVMFQNVPFYAPQGSADGDRPIGVMSGILAITHMPKFCQMYAGQNIDGVVHDGATVPGAKYFPPRCKNLKKGDKI